MMPATWPTAWMATTRSGVSAICLKFNSGQMVTLRALYQRQVNGGTRPTMRSAMVATSVNTGGEPWSWAKRPVPFQARGASAPLTWISQLTAGVPTTSVVKRASCVSPAVRFTPEPVRLHHVEVATS